MKEIRKQLIIDVQYFTRVINTAFSENVHYTRGNIFHCHPPMRSWNAFDRICLSVCLSWTESKLNVSTQQQISMTAGSYIFWESRSSSCIKVKVAGATSRSRKKKRDCVSCSGSVQFPGLETCAGRYIFRISRSRSSIEVKGQTEGHTGITKYTCGWPLTERQLLFPVCLWAYLTKRRVV